MSDVPQTRDAPIQPSVVFTTESGIEIRRYAVSSTTEDQPHGVLVVDGMPWGCSCLGYRYRWQNPLFSCHHMKIMNEQLKNKRRTAQATTSVDGVLAKIGRHDPKDRFSRTRYPYTYACDLVRGHPEIVPETVMARAQREWAHGHEPVGTWDRAFATRVRQLWAQAIGWNDDELAEVLAYSYLVVNDVEIPEWLEKPQIDGWNGS